MLHTISSIAQDRHERMYTFQSLLISIFLVHLVMGQTCYANFDLNSVPIEGIQWLVIILTVAWGNKQLPTWAFPPLLHPCLCPSHLLPAASLLHFIMAPGDATFILLLICYGSYFSLEKGVLSLGNSALSQSVTALPEGKCRVPYAFAGLRSRNVSLSFRSKYPILFLYLSVLNRNCFNLKLKTKEYHLKVESYKNMSLPATGFLFVCFELRN